MSNFPYPLPYVGGLRPSKAGLIHKKTGFEASAADGPDASSLLEVVADRLEPSRTLKPAFHVSAAPSKPHFDDFLPPFNNTLQLSTFVPDATSNTSSNTSSLISLQLTVKLLKAHELS